eukprot:TRINITY_DN674_c0_g1_i1.p2 TRINITY_DN674_c0_g1~~TRINITY_DN674_c0_g1_i1.p2  ORF type:complete len:295 (-),score=63.59 TRINITY_DN674_c0_g1_i1:49-933(-)
MNELLGVTFGERKSREINSDGLFTLCAWWAHDVADAANCIAADQKAAARRLSSMIESRCLPHFDIISGLLDAFVNSRTTNSQAGEQCFRLVSAAELLSCLLKYHSEEVKASRVQELICLFALLWQLRATPCLNCKSGCDRTGVASAVATAWLTMVKTRPAQVEELVNVAMHYDAMVKGHAIRQQLLSAGAANDIAAYRRWCDEVAAAAPTRPDSPLPPTLLLLEFLNCVLGNLVEVSWPIVTLGTGVCGFKLGTNPNLQAVLPPFVNYGGAPVCSAAFRGVLKGICYLRGGGPS